MFLHFKTQTDFDIRMNRFVSCVLFKRNVVLEAIEATFYNPSYDWFNVQCFDYGLCGYVRWARRESTLDPCSVDFSCLPMLCRLAVL
jgi:hypothetical protein